MHIIMTARSLPTHHLGGMEQHAWLLAHGLTDRGHDVTLVTTAVPASKAFPSVPFDLLPVPGTRPGEYSLSWWQRLPGVVLDLCRSKSFDVHLSISAAGYPLVRYKEQLGIPFAFLSSGGAIGQIRSKLRERGIAKAGALKSLAFFLLQDIWKMPRFDKIVCESPRVYREVSRLPYSPLLIRRDRIECIPLGIDTDLFAPPERVDRIREELSLAVDELVVLYVGRLHQQKGCDTAIRAFAKVRKELGSGTFLLVGSGPAEEELRQIAAEAGVAPYVRFEGFVEYRDLPKYYQGADIFVFCTRREEGQPLNMLEAMSTQLACLISRHVGSDVSGVVLVNPYDVNEVASELRKLAGDSSVRSALGEQARGFVLSHRALEGELRSIEESLESMSRQYRAG